MPHFPANFPAGPYCSLLHSLAFSNLLRFLNYKNVLDFENMSYEKTKNIKNHIFICSNF
jgi:hypothetical protein